MSGDRAAERAAGAPRAVRARLCRVEAIDVSRVLSDDDVTGRGRSLVRARSGLHALGARVVHDCGVRPVTAAAMHACEEERGGDRQREP